MLLVSTLSAPQWTRLQSAFGEALSVSIDQREALLQALYRDDERVADALAGMLDAADRWRGHTGEARADLVQKSAPLASLQPGDMLGLYRIVSEIGRGGMGRVYLGERSDGRVQQRVAIKIVRPGGLDDFTRDRFRLERELLAGFNHPNIARLFDAGESAGGEPYFVMEYVQGETLTKYCNDRRLGLHARLNLFLSVCDAVRYAHSKLVLHRDLKPGNILVDEHGVPKLIDFGIAKSLPTLDAEDMQTTATQRRFFSPLNAAPEQLRGERVGLACDVYQLGTVLYELLCGFPIFDLQGKTPTQIEECILQQMPVAPSTRVESADNKNAIAQSHSLADGAQLAWQLKGDLDEITLLALRKEPERRYASVDQLADDIGRHLNDQPVQARGQHGWYRASRFAKRHWRPLSLAAMAALFTIGFVTTVLIQGQRLARERDRAVTEQRRSDEVTQFLVGIFKAGDPGSSLERGTPIGKVLDIGRGKLQSKLANSPRIRANLLLTLAEVYSAIDDLAAAQDLGGQAIDAYRKSASTDVRDTDIREQISVLDRWTSLLLTAAKPDQALAVANEAMALHRQLGDSLALSWESELNQTRADIYHHEAQACAHLRELIDRLRAGADTNQEPFARAAIETNVCEHTPGDPKDADVALVREAVGVFDKLYGRDDPVAQLAHHQLAAMLPPSAEALAELNNLVANQERVYGSESLAVANELFSRGAVLSDLARDAEAESDYLRAKAIYETVNKGQPSARQAALLANMGNLHDSPEDPNPVEAAKADDYYRQAVKMAEATYDPRAGDLSVIRDAYGKFKMSRGDYASAEGLFRKTLAAIPEDSNDSHYPRAYLARTLVYQGRYDEAESLLAACEAATNAAPENYRTLAEYLLQVRKELNAARAGRSASTAKPKIK